MKKIIKTFLLLLMIIPCIIFADSMVVTYNEAVNNANNYINRYSDRSKYLLLNNVKYIYENGYLSSDSRFIKGGMLNKSEYDLTVIANKTYLMTGREYWTLTTSNTGAKYYIDTFALSKPETGSSGVRVTEQVKGSVQVDGRGTYANPWYFIEGYEVIVKPNNSSFATITPSSQMVKGGATANLNINIKPGYKYANRDDCGLVKKNETTYEIRNVNRDISCIAIFEETIYKMVLTSSKTYTTNPSPSTLYFRPSSGWYSDSRATAKISKITPPTITGYTFNGYNYNGVQLINSTGQILTNTPTGFDYTNENQNLVADITANSYTVTYNLNGGNGCTSKTVTYDGIYGGLCTPTKNGYTFNGWYKEAAFTNKVESSSTVSTASDHNLYAKWTANTYSVSFNVNGGSGGQSAAVTATYGAAMPTINTTKPSKTGHTFTGWYDAASGGTKYYNADCTSAKNYDKTSATTLYAHFTANTYTVSFNANSGSGGQTANVTATYGAAMPTINTTPPTRTSYKFDGWYDDSTGGTQYYTAAGVSSKNFDKTSATTLYAHWTLNAFTVSFNANGGSGGQTANVTATYGAAMPSISTTKPTRTGYTFAGWYDAATGGTQYYKADCTSARNFDKTAATTLYAHWTGQSVTVKFAGKDLVTSSLNYSTVTLVATDNPSTKQTDPMSLTKGQEYILSFDYSSPDGGSNQLHLDLYPDTLPEGPTLTSTSTSQHYDWVTKSSHNDMSNARFRFYSYTTSKDIKVSKIFFSKSYSQTVTYGSAYGTLPDIPGRTGYDTLGWYKSDMTTKITSTSTVSTTSEHILHARWSPITYYVKYNANGGSGSMSNSTHTYNTSKNLTANSFTKTKATFRGWAESASGEKKYDNKQSVKNLTTTSGGTVNLYAVWEPTYTKKTYKCTKATWNSTGSNQQSSCMSGVSTEAQANSSNANSYYTCGEINSVLTCQDMGYSVPCYHKVTYTRKSCSTYSSSASNTQSGLESCTPSSNYNYKYTCTAES